MSKFELPWIEKHRPRDLDDIIDHKEKISVLRALIKNHELPHLLFYGPPGCGKCLGRNVPVLMFDRTIKMVQDIVIGDHLMGDDGKSRTVLSICRGFDQMYQIIPRNSGHLVWTCNEPHILCLKNLDNQGPIIEISVHDFLNHSQKWQQRHVLYQVGGNHDKRDRLVHFTIEHLGEGPYFGFEIDGNGRFLLGDWTVTHNTSMILACAREMYGEQYNRYILELNASDDRGIETVRKKIPDFVKTISNQIRLVILDEVDAMTNDAQSALRRVIEIYSKNSRFCLICNNINKIIPGLQSRCTKMRFGYLDTKEISQKLSTIIQMEGVHISQPALDRLVSINKDFRQILNTLQCLHIIKLNSSDGAKYPPLIADEIDDYLGVPNDCEITDLVKVLFGSDLQKACEIIIDRFKYNQWNLPDLIHRLAEYVIKATTLSSPQKCFLIDHLSDLEFKLSHSNDAEVQLYVLVSNFQQSLNIHTTE